ncbi:hypothetical protein [Shewanella mangrovi]|uniref:hypothetical protein n=1 Tax=Shewanella mangrovi TaxID=1515746 RepID=UPI000AB0E4DB|nr:hypothetical protein [Shewanella mangrovi]
MSSIMLIGLAAFMLLAGAGSIGLLYVEAQKQYKRIDKMNEGKKENGRSCNAE